MSNTGYPESLEDLLSEERRAAAAEANNCDIVYTSDDCLQLDLDSPDALRQFEDQYTLLEMAGLVPFCAETTYLKSKSGNWHVLVRLTKPVPIERRILLQALLGSDLKREALALIRSERGFAHPLCLFRLRETTDTL